MTDIPDEIQRPDPDFSVAGLSFYEWLGKEPNEATIKAAEQAFDVPGAPYMVATFSEPSLPVARFAEAERKRMAVWFHRTHPDAPGRMRVHQKQELHPDTGQDVKVVLVTYQPDWARKSRGGEG
jgi:hypothetical protein